MHTMVSKAESEAVIKLVYVVRYCLLFCLQCTGWTFIMEEKILLQQCGQ